MECKTVFHLAPEMESNKKSIEIKLIGISLGFKFTS